MWQAFHPQLVRFTDLKKNTTTPHTTWASFQMVFPRNVKEVWELNPEQELFGPFTIKISAKAPSLMMRPSGKLTF